MSGKRIALVLLALVLVWYAFFRKPKVVVVNKPVSPGSTVAQVGATALAANQGAVNNTIGYLVNGVASSVAGWFNQPGAQGGSNSSQTVETLPSQVQFQGQEAFVDTGAAGPVATMDTPDTIFNYDA
jgi:hypothetical protein